MSADDDASQEDADDASIADDAGLLRRVHPSQVVPDANSGGYRLSSAAFTDPNLSIDIEPILLAGRADWHRTLAGFSGYSLVRFSAAAARAVGQAVVRRPLPDNDAHGEVIGKKTTAVKNALCRASDWVHRHIR